MNRVSYTKPSYSETTRYGVRRNEGLIELVSKESKFALFVVVRK